MHLFKSTFQCKSTAHWVAVFSVLHIFLASLLLILSPSYFHSVFRVYPSSLVPRRSTTTMARNQETSSSPRATSLFCAGKWMRTGTTERWEESTVSSPPTSSRSSSRCRNHHLNAKLCMTLSSKTRRQTRTVCPSPRWDSLTPSVLPRGLNSKTKIPLITLTLSSKHSFSEFMRVCVCVRMWGLLTKTPWEMV